jgi:hypothetical protein
MLMALDGTTSSNVAAKFKRKSNMLSAAPVVKEMLSASVPKTQSVFGQMRSRFSLGLSAGVELTGAHVETMKTRASATEMTHKLRVFRARWPGPSSASGPRP